MNYIPAWSIPLLLVLLCAIVLWACLFNRSDQWDVEKDSTQPIEDWPYDWKREGL